MDSCKTINVMDNTHFVRVNSNYMLVKYIHINENIFAGAQIDSDYIILALSQNPVMT